MRAKVRALVGVLLMAAGGFASASVGQAEEPAPCPAATVSAQWQAQPEGSGLTPRKYRIPVTVTAPAGCTATGTVRYRVVDGKAHGVFPEFSADNGSDYGADPSMPLTGELSWKDSLETKYVDVAVNQDFLPEQNEAFWVELFEPSGLIVAEDRVPNAVNDDDAKPAPDAVVVAPDGKICWKYCEVPVYGFGFGGAQATANGSQTMTVHYRTVEGPGGPVGYVPVRDAVLTLQAGQPLTKAKVQLLPIDREVKFEIEFFQPAGGKLGMRRTVVTIKPWR
ncbi:hypothetical protein [Amycolatopsis sp. NPDC059657]|uniref:hypothetical protein n=1 Tax=Amycolatopsis sp. NPDC059657 TaxID=3346899 RepID=UPI0036714D05